MSVSASTPQIGPFAKLALDLGPLVIFFATNLAYPGPPVAKVMAATLARP